jgi:hypothetical protein
MNGWGRTSGDIKWTPEVSSSVRNGEHLVVTLSCRISGVRAWYQAADS